MSDEYGHVGGEGDGASGSLEPALADRLDTMHRTMSTLGTRIDALVTSTTTYRAALTDRLNEYTDLVSKLTRAQAADLEEHRRATDQAAVELRQGLTASEQALERVGARIEAMAGGGEQAEVLAELRALREAQEQLGRSLTEALDRSGERTGVVVEEIRETLLDVASGEVVGALWDEFRGARASIDEMRIAVERTEESARAAADAASTPVEVADDPATHLEPLRDDVTSLTAAVRDLLEQAEVVDEGVVEEPADAGMLAAVAADVASLRNELARGLVVEPSDALTGAVDQLRTDVAGLDTRLESITDLQQAVAELRGAVAEVAAAPAPAAEPDPDPTIGRVDDGVRELSQGVANIEARLSAVAERLAELDQLAGLEDRLDQRLAAQLAAVPQDDGVGERLAEVDEQLGAIRERLGQQLEALDQRLGGMDRHLAGIDEVHRVVGGLRDRIEELAAEPEPGPAADDATAEELRSVRDRVTALGERLDSIAVLQEAVTSLRDEVRAAAAAEPAPLPLADDLEHELATLRSGVEGIDTELRAMRSGIEDIIGRLDEGLVLADEIVPPTPAVPPEVADQLAVIRDEVATGFDALRGLADSAAPPPVDLGPITELLEHVRDDIAAVPDRIEVPTPAATDGERYATLDPDIVDLLREEIRTAAASAPAPSDGASDELLESLRKELVALRRRIKLRAEGEIFTDEQLELIAERVAQRLAE